MYISEYLQKLDSMDTSQGHTWHQAVIIRPRAATISFGYLATILKVTHAAHRARH